MVLVPEARSSRQEVRQAIAAQFWGQTASGVRSLDGVSRCAALQSPQAAAHADHIRAHASHQSGTSGLYAIGSSAHLALCLHRVPCCFLSVHMLSSCGVVTSAAAWGSPRAVPCRAFRCTVTQPERDGKGGVRRLLPCEPPPLPQTGASGLSRAQQLLAFQAVAFPVLPAYNATQGGLVRRTPCLVSGQRRLCCCLDAEDALRT